MISRYRIIAGILSILLVVTLIGLMSYLFFIPKFINSDCFLKFMEDYSKKNYNVDFVIKNPNLVTKNIPNLEFKADLIEIKNDETEYFLTKNLNTEISLSKIFLRKIVLKKFCSDYVFADIDKLTEIFKSENQNDNEPSNWKISWFHSLLDLKKFRVLYSQNDYKLDLCGRDFSISEFTNPKYAHFDIVVFVKTKYEDLKFEFSDNDAVFIKDRTLYVKGGKIKINESDITINVLWNEKNHYNIDLNAKGFETQNVYNLINSNLLIANGKEMLKYFDNISGKFDFDINYSNSGLNGYVKLYKNSLTIPDLSNIPVNLKEGMVKITPKEIILSDFKGYYGSKESNFYTAEGSVKDYMKSADTDILVKGVTTNDFLENYLSKTIGYPLSLKGDSKTILKIKSLNNKLNILGMFKVAKGDDILIDGSSISPVNYDRVVTTDLDFINNIIKINKIDYYIASIIDKNSKGIKPILTIDGNLELGKICEIKELGFVIPKPLPSEFLNVLIGQKMFKNGTIAGNLRMINKGSLPILSGELELQKVFVPSQRLAVKQAKLSANDSMININAEGGFKRSVYNFSGKIKNSLKFPIVVEGADLSVDNMDVEKLLTSLNKQNTNDANNNLHNDSDNDDEFAFDTNLIVIKDSNLNLVKGHYKELNFGNLNAKMTLNEDGVLNLHSNRFDFAEGISSLRADCDLKKHDYRLKLGIKDVNSDVVASTILSLPREISGKAKGFISLNTDNSLKLNGEIKFAIDDGNIGKFGLIEYIMKFASLFRNPLAMVNPATVFDIANIPDGHFDKINGELTLKDNVAHRIAIKSTSDELSTLIIGKYDIEKNDAALRIYTKVGTKRNSFAGVLRNISLNNLSNIVPFGSRNTRNYYKAEIDMIPPLGDNDKDAQVFVTTVDGDILSNNFISSLRKIK